MKKGEGNDVERKNNKIIWHSSKKKKKKRDKLEGETKIIKKRYQGKLIMIKNTLE